MAVTYPRIPHLQSAALPAAGAYTTSQAAYAVPQGITDVMVWFSYTRAAVSGQLKFKLLVGNGTEEGPLGVVDATVTASEPFAQQTVRGGEFKGPVPADGNPVIFAIPVRVIGAQTFRVLVAEVGATGTPGTCAIALVPSAGGS